MTGFVKIYDSILRSSIWLESPTTRILWITMLTMADRQGEVAASVGGLAHAANISKQDCEAGLTTLLSPDLDSRSRENDGRRIEPIDGGWRVLNYAKYRELRTVEQVQAALRKAEQRERDKSQDNGTGHASHAEKSDIRVKKSEGENYTNFNDIWANYPKRGGGNSKADALKVWTARIKAGVDPKELFDGVLNYRDYCNAVGYIGTPYVMQARRFFGPGEHWNESWDVPKSQPRPLSKQERARVSLDEGLRERARQNGEPADHHEVPGALSRALPNPRRE